ncbi:hypothetical protein C6N75_09970 [Streptomyces solincola]|uniref:Uncharacterized protein n=1 Tax=Streptomyces solincola TaxID=2100817 RepID=A0A2S9PYA7_9ACTN|nr:hypothetical protein [Streptomyces solincola]PRH79400.1 hypothetical protein C6N75_09970 [Streptomyces solincola]
MSEGKIYIARETFAIGARRMIQKGTTVREGHELLKTHGGLFDVLKIDYEYEAPKQEVPAPRPEPARKTAAPKPVAKDTPKALPSKE